MPRPPTLSDYSSHAFVARRSGRENAPLVSIVTVVYNAAATLQRAMDSVFAQDYPSIEYIVIDGGSTDGSRDIIERNAEKLAYWVSEPDGGIYDAMNKGIGCAHGSTLRLLNADDELCQGAIAAAVATARSHDNEGLENIVVNGTIEVIDNDGRLIKTMGNGKALNPIGPVLHPSWFVGRNVYQNHGLYRTDLRIAADYELFLRLNHASVPFVFCDHPLARFREGGVSDTSWIGLRERFLVNREYYPLALAAKGAGMLAYKYTRRYAAGKILGERGSRALRRWWGLRQIDQAQRRDRTC